MPPRYGAVAGVAPESLVPAASGPGVRLGTLAIVLSCVSPPAGVIGVPSRSSMLAMRTIGVCTATL